MKRIIIVDMPNTDKYRVVCKFGYDSYIRTSWVFHLQEKITRKKYIFWGSEIQFWHQVDWGWFDEKFENMEELKYNAILLYKRIIVTKEEKINSAMSL